MAALCVTLDLTVAVSCTRTDDVIQRVVARSIIRPPVGSTPRTLAAVDEPKQTCTHTFTHERESATRRAAANPRHINRSVNSTHGHESARTSTSPLLDARPPTQTEITHSHTDTRDTHTHKHTFTHERVRKIDARPP